MKNDGFGMAVGLVLFGVSAGALAVETVDLGKQEYEASCAVCHGLSGKGDGPFPPYMTKMPADLTVLQRDNKGVFPFARVYDVIDGRQTVAGHGTRDMPIWGDTFRRRLEDSSYERFEDPGTYVTARILALTEYISRLQAK